MCESKNLKPKKNPSILQPNLEYILLDVHKLENVDIVVNIPNNSNKYAHYFLMALLPHARSWMYFLHEVSKVRLDCEIMLA